MSKAKSSTRSSSVAAARGASATEAAVSGITLPQRERMIAEAAYYRAEHRGFQGGDPQQDWLEAEAEINRMLSETLH